MAIPQKSDPQHRKYKRATRRHRNLTQRNLAQKNNKFTGYYHKPATAYVRKKRVDFDLG